MLWLAGAALAGDRRLLLWIPAVVLDLCAPVAGYWLPRRGRAVTTDYDIEGGHFTDRCQGFIIIALGESIVVTGATAADAGLSSTVVLCLGIAFLETAALWWLYFGAVAERSRLVMSTCEDPGRLARDAYTYLHVPIVAGIIAVAVGDDLLIAEPGRALHGVGLAMVLGGPVLYPRGREPVPAARDRRGQRRAPRGRRDPRAARPARLADQRAGAERDGGRAAERARALGAAAGHVQPSTSPTTTGRNVMKIVVIGGSGRVGRNVVRRLVAQGHDPVPASPATGVDTITGEGLADVMAGADVVVDVSNAPVWDDDAVLEFFTTSTRNLLAAERDAGVGHHVAVSIVGADRLPDSGYLRAKVAQEAEIEAGAIPYTILRATQFFEFLPQIVEAGAEGDSVRLLDRADAVRRRRRRRRDGGRARDRRAGRRPRRARRARGAGHRRLGAAAVRRHRRRAHGHRRPARAVLRHRAARRRADAGRGRAHRDDRLRDVVRRRTAQGAAR